MDNRFSVSILISFFFLLCKDNVSESLRENQIRKFEKETRLRLSFDASYVQQAERFLDKYRLCATFAAHKNCGFQRR